MAEQYEHGKIIERLVEVALDEWFTEEAAQRAVRELLGDLERERDRYRDALESVARAAADLPEAREMAQDALDGWTHAID